MFIDRTKIYVKAGDGGNGAVSFRREKYVSHGGPDGGDGGNGGNIVFRVDKGCNTLLTFRHKRKFVAQNGGNGSGSKFHGANGADVIIPVPCGTIIRSTKGLVIHDMSDGEDFIMCRGGRGGWGNRHFATPTRQAPRFAKNGLPGEEAEIELELKMIADAGLGTINAVVLTVEYIRNHGMDVKGIILNHYSGGAMQEDNEKMIERLTGVPVIARVRDGDRELEVDLEVLKRVYD